MDSPKVSICIPTYNQTHYLSKLLDSIAIQTYKNFEVIISDDSSNEDVKNLVEGYKHKFNILYYKNISALGTPSNWNNAVELSKGNLIKIMHHDDWFTYSNSLEKFILKAQECNNKLIFSEAISFNEKENTKKIHTPGTIFLKELVLNPDYLYLGNLIGPPSSVLFNRNDYIKFNSKLKWLVDIDFYISTLKKTNGFCFINEPLITSVNNGVHNVSNDCMIPEVEVYEFAYLFTKLDKQTRKNNTFKNVLMNVLIRYNINTIDEFKKYSGNIVIDKILKKIIRSAKISMNFKKIKSYFYVN